MSSRSFLRALSVVIAGVALGGTSFVALGRTAAPAATTLAIITTTAATSPAASTTSTTEAQPVVATSTTTIPGPGWLVLHGVGDTNFDPDYIGTFRANGYEYAFAGLGG
ncbi:MAG: hypothetical protein OEO77_14980, partial [Acidimicrobiia bacterium]|nr:hypothetical protein [Acidimicrobiia bacterium]